MSSSTPPSGSGKQSNMRKVAIPRLQRSAQIAAVSKERRRVPRACTACRNHKIKCSGETPRCKHCESTGRDCVYILPRRDRLKIVTDRCIQLAALLSELKDRFGDEDGRIAELLEGVAEDIPENRLTPGNSNPDIDGDDSKVSNGGVASGSGSMDVVDAESHDLLEEDLTRDDETRATGFVGKASEVQWLRSVKLQLNRTEEETSDRRPSYGLGGKEQVSSFNFYLDVHDNDNDYLMDSAELPTPETANHLLQCYLSTVHDSFPILPKGELEARFKDPGRLSQKWQAILNMVFAIGAKYSHLVRASWQADERDHYIYETRARSFGLSEATLSSHPDIPQIQMLGLLAFYYASVGKISRAWVIIGLALRFACALGLHVRNEDPNTSASKKENLVRIWWSLFSLERLLGAMTGRPSIVVDFHCSVPLPLTLPDESLLDDVVAMDRMRFPSRARASPTSSNAPSAWWMEEVAMGLDEVPANSTSYFKALCLMGIITQDVLSTLYSAGTMIRKSADIQTLTLELSERLDGWRSSLPCEFDFQARHAGSDPKPGRFIRERMLLGFCYFGARILLTRPSLGGIEKGFNNTDSFTRKMAAICVSAAKATADFLPDQPNPNFLYENGPWWSIVHNLMQAVTVFLLSLSYSTSGSPENVVLLQYTKKVISWLRAMQDPVAARAYDMSSNMLGAIATRLSLDLSDHHWRNIIRGKKSRRCQKPSSGIVVASEIYRDGAGFTAHR
ncbi:fungal-specific transcription factor domain-domain-containing protein [Clohesyomyces aquaticus]|uniref:Fungal-specific transcription factor domain-domain-containing protein n=1 Tax=Clohesyomyces aquaticus TaxID=1231657 RepID=A0A1Y1ZCG9_9PLEO|nr:fungal-specific transcription factor domain-domain-containing protein [Clohesyomyces aquaticus]